MTIDLFSTLGSLSRRRPGAVEDRDGPPETGEAGWCMVCGSPARLTHGCWAERRLSARCGAKCYKGTVEGYFRHVSTLVDLTGETVNQFVQEITRKPLS